MKKPDKYNAEMRERAVRMMLEHRPDHPSEWAAIESIAAKIGCAPQPLQAGCANLSVIACSGVGLTST